MWVTSVQLFWGLDDLLLSSPIVYAINCLCICLLMNIWVIFQFGTVTIKEHCCISLCTIRAFITLGQMCTCGIAGWIGRWRPEVNLGIIPWEPSSLVLFFFFPSFTLCVCFACLPVCVPCACLLDALELCLWMVVNHHACTRAPSALKCWTSSPAPWFLRQDLSLGLGLVSQLGWPAISNGHWCPSPQS